MVTLLQSRRSYSAQELAEELQVSRRTVFRDLNMLEMAHIPYYYDADSGGYRISQHFFLPPVNLTLPEALAILAMTSRLCGARRTPLLTHGVTAAVKLQSVLPPAMASHVGDALEKLAISMPPSSPEDYAEGLFQQLAEAVTERRVCQLVYISFHERKQIRIRVHPLRLVFQHRGWYVIAFCPKHGEARTFKLVRIRKLTVTEETFTPAEEIDLDSYFGQAWNMIPEGQLYDIHLRFDPVVAANVSEVQWHPSQQVDWHDDGSIDFRVQVDGLGEITWWILSYGDHVQVLQPDELSQRIGQIAARVAGRYDVGQG